MAWEAPPGTQAVGPFAQRWKYQLVPSWAEFINAVNFPVVWIDFVMPYGWIESTGH